MVAADGLDIARTSVFMILRVSGPLLLTALVVGVVVALFQALTHIQELSLVFIPKIIAVFLVLFFMLPTYGDWFQSFAQMIFDRVSQVR